MLEILKGRLLLARLLMLVTAAALLTIGLVTIYAIGHPADPSPAIDVSENAAFFGKQLQFMILGIGAFIIVNIIDYRSLGRASYWIFGLGIISLIVVLGGKFLNLPFAPSINGAHCWIKLHPSLPSIQPSEFFKLAYIFALAWYLRYRSNYRSFKSLIGPFALTLFPMILILLEPDLGTVMLMIPILFIMLFVAGAKAKHLLVIVLLGILVSPLMWHFFMHSYQRIRISCVVLQNEWVQKQAEQHDWFGRVLVGRKFSVRQWKNDWGYHLIRSKYAIASGGLTGYGYRNGPFIKYNFLPERHNDFIFSAIAHQWGFVGCVVLLFLYVLLVACAIEISVHNPDPFARLVAVGIAAMIAAQVIINVSVALGLMPITGLNLPFVSYGGSSLLVNMAAIGILNNLGRTRSFCLSRESEG